MALISTSSRLVKVSNDYSAGSGISIDNNNVISVTGNVGGNTYSAGANIDIYEQDNQLYISGKDWSNDIEQASANIISALSIPVSNSGDLYKVEFDGVDLYGYKSTSSIPYHVYSALSSSNERQNISPSVYPMFSNYGFTSLETWSAFDIISISSNGEKIYPPGQPGIDEGVTALDVYYKASYLYDYDNQPLQEFSGYIGKITHDNLVVTSYFDKPSYYNNIAICHDFELWFSADKHNVGNLYQSNYICSVGNKVESGTSRVEGIIVPPITNNNNTTNNETVLWSGNLYQVLSTNEQLSESITSFNSLKLYGVKIGVNGAAMQVFEFEPRYNSYSATFLDLLWTYREYYSGLVYENLMRVNLRDNQMALDAGWAQTGSNSFQYNTNVTAYDFALCKVVGINRKQ